jgi:D-alanine-D-alanine ligase
MGGLSAEREVSLNTGAGVFEALRAKGYRCVAVDWSPGTSLPDLLTGAAVEVVWNALHGTYGEDGAVQGLLTCMGIAYTGSGVLASALAMDKLASKRIFESSQVPTPRWQTVSELSEFNPADWSWPLVVKPSREGSSVGVTIVKEKSALAAAIAEARTHDGEVLVEDYIHGMEVHVGIVDDQVIGNVEVRPASGFYDYAAKYQRSDTQYLVPAPLDSSAVALAHDVALKAFRSLGCRGHGRVDLRVDPAGMPSVLEVNTLPGMTSTSLLPKIAAHAGMDYAALCERILASAGRDWAGK